MDMGRATARASAEADGAQPGTACSPMWVITGKQCWRCGMIRERGCRVQVLAHTQVCIRMHLFNGTGNSPSLGQPTPGGVKQDKSSRGSVDTTKTRSGPRRVTMSGGERPIGAAKGTQSDTEALCQAPPPPAQSDRHPLPNTPPN